MAAAKDSNANEKAPEPSFINRHGQPVFLLKGDEVLAVEGLDDETTALHMASGNMIAVKGKAGDVLTALEKL